jgi:hypothetical protein
MAAPPKLLNTRNMLLLGCQRSKLMPLGKTKSKQSSALTLLDQVLEME